MGVDCRTKGRGERMSSIDWCVTESGRLEEERNLDSKSDRTVPHNGMDWLQLCDHNDFEVAVPFRSLCFLMIVTGRESSSLRLCPEPQECVYDLTVVKNTLATIL